MKLYTKKGDLGVTSLGNGESIAKAHPLIEALGSLDELTSALGVIKAILKSGKIVSELEKIQQTLILVMGELAAPNRSYWPKAKEDIENLENWIDFYEAKTDYFKGFILPGHNSLSAEVDRARTIARRAERVLYKAEIVHPEIKSYINRLSDYLYSIARYIDQLCDEVKKNKEQMIEMNLELANQIINRVKEYATYKGINVVVAIVTKEGNPISIQVMDDSFVVSYELAVKKAFTAAALKMPTHKLAELTQSGAQFEGLEGMLEGKIITLGGGYPLLSEGKVIGAIGVSGGSALEDIDMAQYGANFIGGE